MKVVGIAKSVSSDLAWTPSSGFYAKYGTHMPSLVNEFVDLRDGRAGIPAFNQRVNRILGHPVNVEDTYDLYGIRKALNVTDLERDGLLLFALAALDRRRCARRVRRSCARCRPAPPTCRPGARWAPTDRSRSARS